ncbi:putative proteasome inhibitor isoform X2 [Senna tora]|uniref:Putative proteasome inhibitor isoform X2 n=1 Tax=Senna tora TaxID=362788 RepID=A0A834XHD5_9FABA|nr:putative proteasome inhibitor isoform X2 [Senna tora]
MATDKTVMAVIRAARPTFRNKYDKIAFAVHASFHASGYVLTATGPHALSDTALSNPSTDEVAVDHWNELDDEYAFVYANPENRSKKVLLKCLVMNDKLLVDALCGGSSEALHLEINVEDYAGDNGSNNYSDQYKNLDKFVKGLDKDILSKLESSSKSASSSRNPPKTSDRSRSGIHEPSVGSGDYSSRIIHPSG